MVAAPSTPVKEEPKSDEEVAEALEMPPSVLLDRLQELLKDGRTRLRFQQEGSEAWGINGTLSRKWLSFSVGSEKVCELVEDGTMWKTADASEWTDDELAQLEQLQQEAAQFPIADGEQARALNPRKCRAQAFAFHKAAFRDRKQGSQPPKAAAAQPARPAKAVVTKAKARAKPSAPAPARSAPGGTATDGDDSDASMADAADEPANSVPNNVAKAKEVDLRKFMKDAKVFFCETFQKGAYKVFLKKLLLGDHTEVRRMLTFSEELQATHQEFQDSLAKKRPRPPKKTPAAVAEEPQAGDSKAEALAPGAEPEASPAVIPPWPTVSVEDALKPARTRGGDAAAQLIRHVFAGRGARASVRLAALKLAKNQESRGGSSKEIVFLRGPPGIGKTAWALNQLSAEVGLSAEEELPGRLIHVCSSRDFMTDFDPKGGKADTELPPPDNPSVEALAMARAKNEARVQLAMEAGVQPIYIDDCHARLWEMTAYAKLAKKHGYAVSVTSPADINPEWCNAAALHPTAPAALSWGRLTAILDAFEPLPKSSDAVAKLLAAKRPADEGPGIVVLAGPRGPEQPPAQKRVATPGTGQGPAKAMKLGAAAGEKDEEAEDPSKPKLPSWLDEEEIPASRASTEAKVASSLLRSLLKK